MEEVDRIILHSLRQIGCDINEEVMSLKQFDSELIVKSAVSCLELIQPGLGLPKSLPHNMAAKYRVGQLIAQACMDNGYPGDMGYQTFLYSGEADVRKVLMFLIEKLPKEQEKFVQEPTGSELLLRKIKSKVKEELSKPWLPYSCRKQAPTLSFLTSTNIKKSPKDAWNEFCMSDIPSNSIERKYLLPTIISLNSRGILAKSHPQWIETGESSLESVQASLVTKFSKDAIQGKMKPPVAPRPKLKEKETNEKQLKNEELLKKEEEILTREVEDLVQSVQQLKFKNFQIIKELEKDETSLSQLKESDALRAKVLELLPDGENNIVKLQKVVESATQRLVSLATQWEKHRVPLIEKYRKSVHVQSSRMNESMKKAETAKSLSEKRKELEIELKNKDQILLQLQSESEKNGKEVNRSAYTRRILEIINNIEKQKTEINKVLRDTRDIQKEINILSGRLDRSFTVADETIFRDAKKDETSRKAYKLLATLHSDCDQLVAMVQETGAILREIRDLEDQIEKEKSKNIAANLERITADLNQMKVESAQLSAQLKLKQQSS
ncbi:hypothetical protein RUM43_012241 [Polyplax serrata]|uniref:Coiled-coil domain-containing protein 22 homolog n=1 Tax=Polyplax serrata TaxID=468196 RepID=A0AAN8S344_POLSC